MLGPGYGILSRRESRESGEKENGDGRLRAEVRSRRTEDTAELLVICFSLLVDGLRNWGFEFG